jgi:hypothetical protein
MAAGDAAAGLSQINALVADGVELGELVDQIVAYLRGVLFVVVTRAPGSLDVPQDIAEMMDRQARVLTVPFLLNALREFIGIRVLLRDQVPGVPQLPIEMAFLRSVLPATAPVTVAAAPTGHGALAQRPSAELAPDAASRAAQREPGLPVPSRAPTAKPAEATSEPLPTEGTGTDLGNLARINWEPFLVLAGTRCGMKVQAALRSVREVTAVGHTIVLQFAHTFSRDLVNQLANRAQVEALWGEILGQPVDVRCTVAGEVSATHSGAPAGAAVTGKAQDDEESLLSDAEKLGAVIKPIT